VEEIPILIVKKDGRREPFDRNKLLRGMMAACQKLPVCLTRLEELARDIHSQIAEQPDREIRSLALGEMVMDGLKTIDSVAYVRFASVYREFKDLSDFVKALEILVGTAKKTGPSVFADTEQADQIISLSPKPEKKPIQKHPSQTPLFPVEITNTISKKRKE
jgi:transcriptional regulator NrdR